MPPPIATEFNWVIPAAGGDPVALWIRSPEAFNDPKMPLAVMQGAIKVLINGTEDTSVRAIFSKDGANVLLMKDGTTFPSSGVKVALRYLQWNGAAYAEVSSVFVEL